MRILYAFLFLSVLFLAPHAYAQSSFVGAENISITMRPEYPAPGESVRLFATSPRADLERSDITWYANNEVVARGPGVKEVSLLAGPLGSETIVSAASFAADGTNASGQVSIRPVELDLLWESDSYAPPFYRGRKLPSAGTSLRVQAITRFQSPGGAIVPERDIVYTWRRNGTVQQSVSGRGKPSATLPAPVLFGTDTIEVEAVSIDGSLTGKASTPVPSVEPMLSLYENHPLFGVMYHQALSPQTFVQDSEMTFTAVPYFAQAQDPSDPRLVYAWKINGKNIPASGPNSNEITLSAANSNGLALIEILLTHAANWMAESRGTWDVSFSTGASGSAGTDPFQPTQ